VSKNSKGSSQITAAGSGSRDRKEGNALKSEPGEEGVVIGIYKSVDGIRRGNFTNECILDIEKEPER
jgi:hypothetical protein